MRSRLLLGFLATFAPLAAQSSVWKVTRGENSFYLGGTCHVLRAQDLPLPPEFDRAFAASEAVYFETDIAQMQSGAMQQVIARHGVFTDGRTLDEVLTPAAWKAVQTYAAAAGLPADQVRVFKPWMFVVLMTANELQKLGVSLEGVDLHYFKQATEAGKRTGELEPFEQQVEFLVRLGAGHESELIVNTLEELGDMPAQLDEMLAAWRKGDVAALDRLMLADVRTRYPAVYDDLFVKRNNAWLPKIEALAKSPATEFVLVGAGHLAGRDGLLAQLRTRGYRIEQIEASTPARR